MASENFGGIDFETTESGLYAPSGDLPKGENVPPEKDEWASQGSSQNEVPLPNDEDYKWSSTTEEAAAGNPGILVPKDFQRKSEGEDFPREDTEKPLNGLAHKRGGVSKAEREMRDAVKTGTLSAEEEERQRLEETPEVWEVNREFTSLEDYARNQRARENAQNQVESNSQQEAERAQAHQEALDKNNKMNEGYRVAGGGSDAGIKIGEMNKRAEAIIEENRRAQAHQEALETKPEIPNIDDYRDEEGGIRQEYYDELNSYNEDIKRETTDADLSSAEVTPGEGATENKDGKAEAAPTEIPQEQIERIEKGIDELNELFEELKGPREATIESKDGKIETAATETPQEKKERVEKEIDELSKELEKLPVQEDTTTENKDGKIETAATETLQEKKERIEKEIEELSKELEKLPAQGEATTENKDGKTETATAETPQEKIERLEKGIDELREKLKTLIAQGVATTENKDGKAETATAETPQEKRDRIEKRIEELENGLGKLTPEEQMEYKQLRKDLKELTAEGEATTENKDGFIKAPPEETLQERREKIEKRIKELENRLKAGELTSEEQKEYSELNKQLEELTAQGEATTENKDGFIKAPPEETLQERREKIQKRITELEDRLKAGALTPEEQKEYTELREQLKNIDQGLREKEDQEAIEKQKKKERNIKRWAIVAGVVGFATTFLGGPSVVAGALVAGTAGNILSRGAEYLSRWRGKKLTEKLQSEENPEEIEKIKKKIEIWNKINNIANVSKRIIGGFTVGAVLGGTLNTVFMGGKGLVNTLNAGKQGVSGVGAPTEIKPNINDSNMVKPEAPSDTTTIVQGNAATTPPTGSISTEALPTEGVLVRNGRINLPGSDWDTNLATKPIGDQFMSTNFSGGATNMGAWNLEQNLINNGITRAQIDANLSTGQIHQLLNRFMANPQTDLVSALNDMGATNLVQTITGN